jgi:TRAP-type uncharacterized transport system fused permease subunit
MKLDAIADALVLGVKNMINTAVLLIGVGLIVMVIAATGLGNTISLLMSDWAGGSLILALLLVALASLVLGMGLPVTASYIVLATLSAPALYELMMMSQVIDLMSLGALPMEAKSLFMLVSPENVQALDYPMSQAEAQALASMLPPDMRSLLIDQSFGPSGLAATLIAAHMIVFWLSQDSNVTPPVCLTAFAAAAIAKSPPMATGLTAWKIAKGIYVIPVLFAFTPLLSGDWGAALEVFFFAAIGLYALSAAMAGYAERPLSLLLRLIVGMLGITLLWPLGIWQHLGLAVVAVAFLFAAPRRGFWRGRHATGHIVGHE